MSFGITLVMSAGRSNIYEVDLTDVDKERDRLVIRSANEDKTTDVWFVLEDTTDLVRQLRVDREKSDQDFIQCLDEDLRQLGAQDPHKISVYLQTGLVPSKPRFSTPPTIHVLIDGAEYSADIDDKTVDDITVTVESLTLGD